MNKPFKESKRCTKHYPEEAQKQAKAQTEAMKKQQEEAQKQARVQTEAMQKQNNELQEKLKGMQKSLEEFTKTNSQLIKSNEGLNNTIRRLTLDLTAAQNQAKDLERRLNEQKKGCMSGCLGMVAALITVVGACCFLIVNVIL